MDQAVTSLTVPTWLLVVFTAILAVAAGLQAWAAHRQANANEQLKDLTGQYVELTHELLATTREKREREIAREHAAAASARATLRQQPEAITFSTAFLQMLAAAYI